MSALNFPMVNVAQLFREQCQLSPNHIAICCKNEQISYQQLDWLSNQLALYLIESGVKAYDLIGVYLDSSIIMVAGLLAILKVGAAYLPLDKKYPKHRLNYLISDSKINKLISLSDFSGEFKETLMHPILLDSFWKADIAVQETDFDIVNVDVNSVAYVNYTSGSTGYPKGVIIPHRGIISLVSKQKAFKLDSSTVTLQLAPISFDALTFELWGPLLNGGRCVLFPYPLPMVSWLRETIQQYGVNAAFITSSLFNVLIDEEPDVFSSMDYVLVGGEALSARHIYKAYHALPNVQLKNLYGPTECTTFAIGYDINQADENAKTIPIGKPISNRYAYILDNKGCIVTAGTIGEIYIGGAGLALGYLNKSELTKEKFVFIPGIGPLYKTGDLAYFLPNGDIEYVGREDNQIKLHGFRIELDEIDAVLRRHSDVDNSVTLIDYDSLSEKKLFSYVVLSKYSEATLPEIMGYLKEQLPYFMIPNFIYEIAAIPLNANGKLDKSMLKNKVLDEQGCLV